jgi:hypothetical protein
MEKWSYAIIATVVAAGLLGAATSESERRVPLVKFHVRTAHCQLAGASRPMTVKMVCS